MIPKHNLLKVSKLSLPMLAWLGFTFLQFFLASPIFAKGMFSGEINEDKINLRVDATVASEIICRLNRGDVVEVVKVAYDWYKIRLPKTAPSFIRQDLLSKINDKSARVLKENVNVRLRPSEDAPIIGRADKDEIVSLQEEKNGWCRVMAIGKSFGWVNKKFVNKITAAAAPVKKEEASLAAQKPAEVAPKGDAAVIIEGIVEPYGKIFKRKGTHKLITQENKVFLLKGNTANLNALTYHKVRVTGKIALFEKEKFPVIEILKMEILN